MPSRPMTRANIIDSVNNVIGTTLTTTWTDAKINLLLDDALTEVSESVPYVMRDVYQLETRTGTATSTTALALVDATEAQFASTDVGKVVYNVDDKTWAVIVSWASTSQVGVSKDIFTSGEDYEIYNEGCWAQNQININNSSDFLWIVKVCYPVDRANYGYEIPRNWNLVRRNENDNIVEIDADWFDDTKDTDADKDVYVYLAKQHKLNTMTDLYCETTSAYAAGVTSIGVDGLTNADTPVPKDSLFYFTQIQGVTVESRNIYRVLADATIGSTAATLTFYPALECILNDNDDITFIGSTLTPTLERILVQIVSGEALMAEGVTKINATAFGGASVSRSSYDIGERMAEKARRKLRNMIDVELRATHVYSRS